MGVDPTRLCNCTIGCLLLKHEARRKGIVCRYRRGEVKPDSYFESNSELDGLRRLAGRAHAVDWFDHYTEERRAMTAHRITGTIAYIIVQCGNDQCQHVWEQAHTDPDDAGTIVCPECLLAAPTVGDVQSTTGHLEEALRVALDAMRRSAADHNCDYCRADIAAVERTLDG